MAEFLKGNFKVKREVVEQKDEPDKKVADELRERVLANICGSMVYVDQTELTWDGDAEDESET